MATVCGVRFKKAAKVYYFDPTGVWPQPGDYVIVETIRGLEMGETVTGAREVADETLVAPLKKVLRLASAEDVAHAQESAAKEGDALEICQRKIAQHKLDMKLVDAEYTFDGSKLIFYFTANGRVDFRDLVKDLAGVFKMRIELRQIGVRDEAKMLGGLGACGRPICCGAFLNDFQPVSIRMAKDQNLSLNPTKISGQCGRLMCCLKYEQDNYEAILKRLPKVGREIVTPDGTGVVTEIAVIREKVKVRMHQPDDTFEIREYGIDEVCRPGDQLPERDEEPSDDPLEDFQIFPQYDVPEREEKPAPQPRREKKDRPPRPAREAKPDAEEQGKRRYPRPKAKKQSAEQYFAGKDAARRDEKKPDDAGETTEE